MHLIKNVHIVDSTSLFLTLECKFLICSLKTSFQLQKYFSSQPKRGFYLFLKYITDYEKKSYLFVKNLSLLKNIFLSFEIKFQIMKIFPNFEKKYFSILKTFPLFWKSFFRFSNFFSRFWVFSLLLKSTLSLNEIHFILSFCFCTVTSLYLAEMYGFLMWLFLCKLPKSLPFWTKWLFSLIFIML